MTHPVVVSGFGKSKGERKREKQTKKWSHTDQARLAARSASEQQGDWVEMEEALIDKSGKPNVHDQAALCF